jgi:predicted DNA-binding transcriptional regulator AlpA
MVEKFLAGANNHILYPLDEKEAARFLGLSIQTLRNWRHLRKGPAYLKVGGRAVRYRLEDLESFLGQCKIIL